jgi:hypothetical protein
VQDIAFYVMGSALIMMGNGKLKIVGIVVRPGREIPLGWKNVHQRRYSG